jgi:hypothetical protein
MTLDEAIRHCEEVAEAEEQKYKEWRDDYSHLKKIDSCLECAKEHRQLAKWLKELKAFRSGINCSTCKYREVDGIDHPCIYCHPSENRWEYGGAEE